MGCWRALRLARLVTKDNAPLHAAVRIAAFGLDAPACCGAFVDERRIVVGGDEGGRVHIIPRRAVAHRRMCASLVGPFAAGVPVGSAARVLAYALQSAE